MQRVHRREHQVEQVQRQRFSRARAAQTKRRRSGFTLLEVLLVLAILGVIAAMVVPQLLGRQKQANIDASRFSIASLESALDNYAVDHDGEYPQTNPGLEVLIVPQQDDPKWRGPYLKNSNDLPKDAWGNPFQYEYPGKNQRVGDKADIWSWGPDKTNGTADDINNWTVKQ
jgi:general secretion pathway protein G